MRNQQHAPSDGWLMVEAAHETPGDSGQKDELPERRRKESSGLVGDSPEILGRQLHPDDHHCEKEQGPASMAVSESNATRLRDARFRRGLAEPACSVFPRKTLSSVVLPCGMANSSALFHSTELMSTIAACPTTNQATLRTPVL
jgi:hypothetical protein